jgi:hypothetical protein
MVKLSVCDACPRWIRNSRRGVMLAIELSTRVPAGLCTSSSPLKLVMVGSPAEES